MDRRAGGLGVVMTVLLVALVVPALGGRRIGGTPTAIAVTAAPAVGDCLLQVAPDPAERPGAGDQLRLVPCALPHDGEVITVSGIGSATPVSGVVDRPVRDLAACASTAYQYFGVHPLDGENERSALLGTWWPGFAATFAMLRPGSTQVRSGQAWSACVLSSPHGSTAGTAAQLYGGSPRSSPFALCTSATDIGRYRSIPCRHPHSMEILGWRVTDESARGAAEFGESCNQLARRVTAMDDPSARGALRVAVVVIRADAGQVLEGWGPGHAGPYRAACTISVAVPRQLTGSLTGLGDGPLPWK